MEIGPSAPFTLTAILFILHWQIDTNARDKTRLSAALPNKRQSCRYSTVAVSIQFTFAARWGALDA